MSEESSNVLAGTKSWAVSRISKALASWTNPLINTGVCFECGKEFELAGSLNYAERRTQPHCERHMGIRMHSVPDVIIHNRDQKSVIYVNDAPHGRKPGTVLDSYEILLLKELGYKIFIIRNTELERLRYSNLVALVKTIVDATADDCLYYEMMKDEKVY
jgi:hypothetical protein